MIDLKKYTYMLQCYKCYKIKKRRHGLVFMATFLFYYFPFTIFLISFSLFRASRGVRLFTSIFRISSRTWQSTGSSNWKKLSCIPSRLEAISAVGLDDIPCWRLSVSSWFKMVLARFTMLFGMPANFATWIPNECSLPPLSSLRRKMTLLSTYFTDTL